MKNAYRLLLPYFLCVSGFNIYKGLCKYNLVAKSRLKHPGQAVLQTWEAPVVYWLGSSVADPWDKNKHCGLLLSRPVAGHPTTM